MKSNYPVLLSLIVITLVAASTAVRVELLNSQLGGYLPRPQPPSVEGNDIPWRTTSSRVIEESYRRYLLADRGIEITDSAISSLKLSPAERQDLDQQIKRNEMHSQLKYLLESWGIWQHLLVPAGIILCVVLFLVPARSTRLVSLFCGCVLMGAGILMLYRQYYFAIAA